MQNLSKNAFQTYYTNFNVFPRHVLAMVHFNSNLDREDCTINGTTQVKVNYPKFKNGEAVVRNVKVAQKFGKKGLINSMFHIAY